MDEIRAITGYGLHDRRPDQSGADSHRHAGAIIQTHHTDLVAAGGEDEAARRDSVPETPSRPGGHVPTHRRGILDTGEQRTMTHPHLFSIIDFVLGG